jgi:hypothetical protein
MHMNFCSERWQVLRSSATAIPYHRCNIHIQKHFAITREASQQILIQIIQMHAQSLSFSESAPDAKFAPLVPVAVFAGKAAAGAAIGWGVNRALNNRFPARR